jgi:hypothetical protein
MEVSRRKKVYIVAWHSPSIRRIVGMSEVINKGETMKNITHVRATIVLGTLMAVVALNPIAYASDKVDPKMEEMMKKMEAAGTPGAAHKALDPLVGDWEAEVKMWMAPDAPPTVTKATAKSTWVMKGRFVQQEFNGEFMGKPFRGLSLTGYDNAKQKYNSVWIDDMNTTMFTSEGEGTDGNKVITLEGSYDCAMTGEKNKASRQVYRIISRDKHIFEMHDPSKGANSKTMEITYTRK